MSDNLPESLEKYKKALESLADTDNSFIVENTGRGHAEVLTGTILKYANKPCLFSDKLDIDITKHSGMFCMEAFQNAIVEGKDIKIITRENPKKSQLLNELKDNPNVSLEVIKKEYRKTVPEFNFIIDYKGKIFRREYDTSAYKAFASFNSEKLTGQLSEIFDMLKGLTN